MMSVSYELACPRCGYRSNKYTHKCPRCGTPLELLSYDGFTDGLYGEGSTPLVRIKRDGSSLLLKLDYLNPTGSFKDRGVSYSIQAAVAEGYECVVEDSSGNTGLSTAAIASMSGLDPVVVVPRSAAPGKKALIKAAGARLIEAETRAKAAEIAEEMAERCFYVSHATSPIFIEGVSTLAKELKDIDPDIPIFIPVSSGTLLLGLWRGFDRLGVEARLIAVQASEAANLRGRVKLLAEAGGHSSKLADALVYKNPPRIDEMAKAASGLVVIGDGALRDAWAELLGMGFLVEPSSASVYAAYKTLRAMGLVDDALLVLTGSGLKYSQEIMALMGGSGDA